MAEVVVGTEKLYAALQALDKKMRTKVLRKALTAAGQIVLAAERQFAPVETAAGALAAARSGMFKRALTKKFKASGGRAVMIIGPRKNQPVVIGTRIRGRRRGAPVIYDPGKIGHLVERGSKRSKGHRMLEQAMAAAATAAAAAMIEAIRSEVTW